MNTKYLIALGIFLGLGGLLFAVLAFFVAPNASYSSTGASSDLDAEALRVAKGLYCPVCPGVPLDACETQACVQWRALIRQKLSEGQTGSQIEAYFVEQYGERVLGAPRAQGINLVVYAVPAFAISAGAALLYLIARRRSLALSAEVPVQAAANPYRSRIERELQEND